jgi:prepilin-type N-terminal cleavage/methylation domain-containing protein
MQSVKGFTMIELIMVAVVIGMVALFAIPNYNKAVSKTYEKTGANNLLILYAAQNILKTGGGAYQTCADVGACNTALSLSVLANGLTYSCTTSGGPPPTAFDCRAQKGTEFTLKVLSSNNNVCCQAGTCNIYAGC